MSYTSCVTVWYVCVAVTVQVENEHYSTVSGLRLVMSLECFIVSQLLAVFSYTCLNLYNSSYTNVHFLPVTATYVYPRVYSTYIRVYMYVRVCPHDIPYVLTRDIPYPHVCTHT